MNRMLITGASGYLGGHLAGRAASRGWSVVGTYLTSAPTVAQDGIAYECLDIRDRAAVEVLLARLRPDVVVHAAAGRDDWPTIADGTAHVALAVAAVDARLVHLSSDAIFAGRPEEYDETATPDPVYRYGAAKAAAETAVRAIAPGAAVVRTSLILGDGQGGQEVMTRELISGRRPGVLFTDEIRKPVHVEDLADAVLELAENDYRGILNVAGADAVSRYDLGVLVARQDGLDPDRLRAATLSGLGLSRPAELRLSIARATSVLSIRLRGAREFLAAPEPA